ncbi:MAG: glycosyltransferase [Endomicrobiales bacterium]
MRIVQLISSSGFYGAENMVLELSQGLRGSGHEVIVANLGAPHKKREKIIEKAAEMRLPFAEIPCRGRLDVMSVKNLKRIVEEHGVEIVHSHGYNSNFYALWARNGAGTKLVATCHNWLGESARMKYYRYLDKLVIRKFDRVVTVSRLLRQEIAASGVAPERVTTIHNGISAHPRKPGASREALRREHGIGGNVRVVGTVGRLSPEKGHAFLLEAAREVTRRCPGVAFVLVGDGPARRSLESKAAALGMGGRVIFAGNRDNVADYLELFDLFVLPSLKEGLPMALLEAMRAGKPVVATKVGEVPLVVGGEAGILVEPGETRPLSGAILSLLEDGQRAAAMAGASRAAVRRRFSSERMTEEYITLYGKLLMSSPPGKHQ